MPRKLHRPQTGGTLDGLRPANFEYWRVGYADPGDSLLDFWVETVGEYLCKPHHTYSMMEYQVSRWTRVFYVVEGSAEFQFENDSAEINVGDLIIIPPNHPCTYSVKDLCRYHWFAIAGQWPGVWGSEAEIQQRSPGIDSELVAAFDNLRELMILQSPVYELQAMSAFYAILARVELLQSSDRPSRSSYPDTVRNAIIFIEENCSEGFDASRVAGHVAISPSHLRSLFSKWVGESPRQYHTRCRMERARQIFQNQRLPVQAVAGMVGFHDVSYFSRVFKQVMQQSPGQYLKTLDAVPNSA